MPSTAPPGPDVRFVVERLWHSAVVLLAVAFLIMPAVAARPFAATPERMAVLAATIGVAGVLGGLGLSFWLDVPGGPAIVLVLAALALSSVTLRPAGRAR